jgi:iron complex outermembrane receptor protein
MSLNIPRLTHGFVIAVVCSTTSTSQAGEKSGRVLEEVLVTAQKKSESINDVPITITALSGDDLKDFGIRDTRDLGKVTPGFVYSESGIGTPVYTLRGVGFNDQTFFASPTVSVYVDETPLPFSFMTKGASLDLARVEVLKGPQGTLFGRNTTGGAINYVANKPSDEFEATVTATYSRFDTVELEGAIGGSLSETFNGRLAVKHIQSGEGWQYSVSRPEDRLGKIDKQALRGILEWLPSDTVTARLTLDGWRDHSDAQAPQPIAITPQNPFTGGAIQDPAVENATLVPLDSDDNRVAEWGTEFKWQLRDSYRGAALNLRWDFTDTASLTSISSRGKARADGSFLPAGLNAQVSDYEIDAYVTSFAQELRLAWDITDALDVMIGTNYAADEGSQHNHAYDRDVSSAFPVLGVIGAFTEIGVRGNNDARQFGGFANLNWQFTNTWLMTLGARYNDERTDYEGCSFDEPTTQGGLSPAFTVIAASRGSVTPIAPGECFSLDENGSNEIFSDRLNEHSVTGRTALTWTPDDDKLFFLSFSRGVKSGGYPVLPASNQSQLLPVTQEILDAWETGAKLTLLEGSMQFNASLFDYDYTDKQLLTRINDPNFGPLPILKNAPESTVRGAEISLSSSPIEGLFASFAGSYIETEVKEFESLDINGNPQDFAGRPFNYAPEKQLTGLLDYALPIGSKWTAGASIDFSYTDETNATLEGNSLYTMRDYTIWNARMRFGPADEQWKVTIWGRNLTNEFKTVNVYSIADVVARYTGMPQVYGITVNYRFGS